jgi:hypothetical protein
MLNRSKIDEIDFYIFIIESLLYLLFALFITYTLYNSSIIRAVMFGIPVVCLVICSPIAAVLIDWLFVIYTNKLRYVFSNFTWILLGTIQFYQYLMRIDDKIYTQEEGWWSLLESYIWDYGFMIMGLFSLLVIFFKKIKIFNYGIK